jgi:Phage integrase, N-terminal SAM-like domain/Phage integrase family
MRSEAMTQPLETRNRSNEGRPVPSVAAKGDEAKKAAAMTGGDLPVSATALRLLDQLREAARQQGHNEEAAKAMAEWCRRFVMFHGKRHPKDMGLTEVGQFLQHVAATEKDALRLLDVARSGLAFLYAEVLHLQVGELPLPRPPKLLDQVRQVMRVRHYAIRTEECYVQWVERYIRFHRLRHPRDMGVGEIELFLSDLAVAGQVSASTQNQALAALLFLYQEVMRIDVGRLDAVRARRPKRVPLVLSQPEVGQLLTALDEVPTTEPYALMARLMYGAGLRLMECCRLRMKDIDLERGQLSIRGGKGDKDRFVMLPKAVRTGLQQRVISDTLFATLKVVESR